MRLDKYLKVSRLVKRRPVANALCDGGNVMVNGKVAKASTTVQVDDVLAIGFGNRTLTVKILQIPTGNVSKAGVTELYDLLEETYHETLL